MKKYIIFIIAAIFTVSSFAQTISENSIDGKVYVEVGMKCENANLGDIKIMLNANSAKKFIKSLRDVQNRAEKCAEIADKNNVKSYNKTLEGSYSYSKLEFNFDNCANVADYNSNNYLAPYFNVDSEGNSHILLGGYYAGVNNSDNSRSKFFFYMSVPVSELDSWINNFEIACNDIYNKKNTDNGVNEIYMALK